MVYREVVKGFLHRIKNSLGINPSDPIKLDEAFKNHCIIRFGKVESDKLLQLLQFLQSKSEDDAEVKMVKVVQQIRQFSIRNKLDQNG